MWHRVMHRVLRDSNRVRVCAARMGGCGFALECLRCTAQVSVEMIEAILRLRKSEQVMVGCDECAVVGSLCFAQW